MEPTDKYAVAEAIIEWLDRVRGDETYVRDTLAEDGNASGVAAQDHRLDLIRTLRSEAEAVLRDDDFWAFRLGLDEWPR